MPMPKMHGPANYRICVRGRLGGMQVSESRGTDGQPETILVGRVVDQAMLSGILNSLYEMHLPVLSAECVDSENCRN